MAASLAQEAAEAFNLPPSRNSTSSDLLMLPIQVHSRPATPQADQYNAAVLSLDDGTSEEALDDRLNAVAFELNVPTSTMDELKHALDEATDAVSALTVASLPDSSSVAASHSDDAASTRPTSVDSNEPAPKQDSPTTPSAPFSPVSRSTMTVTSTEPTPSVVSRQSRASSSFSRLRQSFRRFSLLGPPRESMISSVPPSAPVTPSRAAKHQSLTPRSTRRPQPTCRSPSPTLTAISTSRSEIVQSPRRMSSRLSTRSESRATTPVRKSARLPSLSESCVSTPVRRRPTRPLTPPLEASGTGPESAARERSLRCGHLQRLRIRQLEEQARFVRFRHEQHEAARNRHAEAWRLARRELEEQMDEAQTRHSMNNNELEMRHLAAELELEQELAAERRACETKLKHMEAYCHGRRSTAMAPDMPVRAVTEQDFRKLLEQYALRNSLEQLHASRINVLREKQARQVGRVASKQEAELQRFEADSASELERLEAVAATAETELKRTFARRKQRMIQRWRLVEAIERRKLELARGYDFGEMPEVHWGAEERVWEVS